MLAFAANSTEEELEVLAGIITDAITKVREGTFISLNQLERRVDSICESLLKQPAETAKPLATKLEDMVSDLDTLRELMIGQLTAMNYKRSANSTVR